MEPNRFRVPVDDLFRVDALLPTALPSTKAPLPGPGTAKGARLALRPANLPQFDPVADGDEEPPPPRAEDRLVEIEAGQPSAPAHLALPALPTRGGELARGGQPAHSSQPAQETAARKPGQWQGAYWSQRKAAAAGLPKPGDVASDSAAPTYAIDMLGPIVLAGAERSADAAELAEVAAYIVLHPGCPVQQMAEELWPAHPEALAIVDAQLVRLREALSADEQLLRVSPESVTLAPSVSCDWLEFLRGPRTANWSAPSAWSEAAPSRTRRCAATAGPRPSATR